MRSNLRWIVELIIVFGLYYLLSSFIENTYVLLGVFVVSGIIIISIRSIFIRNQADILEVLVNPDRHFESIKKFEQRDSNKYNTLYAYGLVYTGEYELAREVLDKVVYEDIKTSRNLSYSYNVTRLHLAYYYNKDRVDYKNAYESASEVNVFKKVDVPAEAFEAHKLLLDSYSEKAEELLKEVIPKVKKRILIIELEYLLALAYYNQNKKDDCKAVCEFVVEKDYSIIQTQLCKELLDKVS